MEEKNVAENGRVEETKQLANKVEKRDLNENTLVQTDQWLFWNTQPVPKMNDPLPENSGQIDVFKKPEDVQKNPYNLQEGFEWVNINLKNDNDLDQLYTLLFENYVEDDDNMFRFDYSRQFLKWALTPPGQYDDWLVGVRVIKSKKLVGFISGIPVHVVVKQNKFERIPPVDQIKIVVEEGQHQDDRNQLFMREQETKDKKTSSCLNQGNHSQSQHQKYVAGCLHCWCSYSQTHLNRSIFPQISESEETH